MTPAEQVLDLLQRNIAMTTSELAYQLQRRGHRGVSLDALLEDLRRITPVNCENQVVSLQSRQGAHR